MWAVRTGFFLWFFFSHLWNWSGIFLEWIHVLKTWLINTYISGFYPVWTFSWSLKMLPHSSYFYGSSVVWILWPKVGCEVLTLNFEDFYHIPYLYKFFSCMDFLMFSECWDLSKGFSTLETFERFLYMYSPMTCKVWISTEELATLITFERSLSSMNSPMMSKMWFLTEDFSTLITSVRVLTGMNCLMPYKEWFYTTGLATLIPFVRFLSSVNCLMP